MKKFQSLLTGLFLLVSILPLAQESVKASGFENDVILCADDRPCINNMFQNERTLIIQWTSSENYSAYNVRWSRPGKNETQIERSGGTNGDFRVTNAHAGTTYTFKVQGCNKRFLASSRCSPWEERTIIAH
jgi:Fibronectin type III domain